MSEDAVANLVPIATTRLHADCFMSKTSPIKPTCIDTPEKLAILYLIVVSAMLVMFVSAILPLSVLIFFFCICLTLYTVPGLPTCPFGWHAVPHPPVHTLLNSVTPAWPALNSILITSWTLTCTRLPFLQLGKLDFISIHASLPGLTAQINQSKSFC